MAASPAGSPGPSTSTTSRAPAGRRSMALPFDATLKEIVAGHTQDYEAALDLPAGPAGVLNVDLSTLSAATDVALGYGDPVERVVDINFQASFAEKLPRRLLLYSAAFH